MPPARLPERPKPPTGTQMLADIASAEDNDVVFLKGHAMDLTDLTPTTLDGASEGGDKALTQAALAQAEARESAQRAYHKALELIEHVKTLEGAPQKLEEQYNHLKNLSDEMSKAIKDLQGSSNHVVSSGKSAEEGQKKAGVFKSNKKTR